MLTAMPPSQPPLPAASDPRLRQVTILFLDIVGSTPLSQHLDPEEIHDLMDGALARGTAVVLGHHGRVLQYAGDNLLAVFGADVAHEDDADHAVRCGLALLALGRELGAEVQQRHGHAGFDVRVGVHTGGVLLGGGVDAGSTIRGIAVNIAARLEQTAPPGGLQISHDTYAQVRWLFDVVVQPPMQLKGIDDPVQTYLVRGSKPRSFRIVTRGIEGVATRMVGRALELALLQTAFEQLFVADSPAPRLQALTVVAEAGLGKSRLLYEFEAWAELQPQRYTAFRGRATPHTQGQPFGLLRDMLAWRFQIADDDSLATARATFEAAVVPLFVHDDGADLAEGHAHLLGHLIGIDWRDSRHVQGIVGDARQVRGRALHTAAQLFRRLWARDGTPVVVQLDDLHWADDESLDFLAQLAQTNADMPLLLLCFSRPGLFERRSAPGPGAAGHRRIDLAPLDASQSQQMADELLKALPAVPGPLKHLVACRAEGNPFYMEELVKMLVDRGAIRTGAGPWALDAEKLLSSQVPGTLTGVLQARLDGLPGAERLTLQEASVIGAVFWDRALLALNASADQTLPGLVRRELTVPRGDAAPDGLREYAFGHQILHQVTYETLLKRHRRELHAKLAHWLSGLTGLRAADFLAVTAGHYEMAGDDANAAEFHTRAAEHACGRLAHGGALHHGQRALALLDKLLPPAGTGTAVGTLAVRWRALKVLETTLDLQGRRAEQRAVLSQLDALAEQLDDDHARAEAAWRRAGMALRTSQWAEQRTAAQRGAALAQRAGDDTLRLLCVRLEAAAVEDLGDWRGGQALARAALAQAQALGLPLVQAYCLNTLGYIAAEHESDPTISLELTRQSLELTRVTGDRLREAIALSNMGQGWLMLGDFDQARRWLEEGLRLQRAHGDLAPQCNSLSNLSRLALWQGQPQQARALAVKARELSLAVGGNDLERLALLCVGLAEMALGQAQRAAVVFDEAWQLAHRRGEPPAHEFLAARAELALQQGDVPTALAQLQDHLGAPEGPTAAHVQSLHRVLQLRCYQALHRSGDTRATDWLVLMHGHLVADAAHIADAGVRQGFLSRIPHHRAIVQAAGAGGGGGGC